jgi:hypothetical protein
MTRTSIRNIRSAQFKEMPSYRRKACSDDGWLHICRSVLAADSPFGTDRCCSRKPNPSCAIPTKACASCQLNTKIDDCVRTLHDSRVARQERASNCVCMGAPLQKVIARRYTSKRTRRHAAMRHNCSFKLKECEERTATSAKGDNRSG